MTDIETPPSSADTQTSAVENKESPSIDGVLSPSVATSPSSNITNSHPLESHYTFWYTHRPTTFRNKNLKPMWEEEGNRNGGKWILRLKKGLSSRLWELLILAVIGEQFQVGKEICGIVCSIRPQEDLISVWTKTANNQNVTQRIRETMKKVLSLPVDYMFDKTNKQFYFRSPNPFWCFVIPVLIVYLTLCAYWPDILPFHKLGYLGTFSSYLVLNHRLIVVLIFWAILACHIYESVLAANYSSKANLNRKSINLWSFQTFVLGYPSLRLVKCYLRDHKNK
ncbi:unnamed protein product [Didymodactylos carnosus]|uniref:Uncharacterized protein n=1 Tax=Didymodactylos carnosus TaxID=1234261 RepID=A0A814IT68_9BILA|nr:unnamed protein product [Didymodactylos carnosus]CAF1025911.1 unnamed protein product [Didymodactylos carnosus]CAF3696612.1 unnamed protein product [Didymodactylos carnosus]CAF3797060.1 unnamed protein product [Didymodactylos carnosus]